MQNKKIKFIYTRPEKLSSYDEDVLKILMNAESLEYKSDYQPPKGTPSVSSPLQGLLYMPLEGLIDVAAEKVRLTKDLAKNEIEIEKVQQKRCVQRTRGLGLDRPGEHHHAFAVG